MAVKTKLVGNTQDEATDRFATEPAAATTFINAHQESGTHRLRNGPRM